MLNQPIDFEEETFTLYCFIGFVLLFDSSVAPTASLVVWQRELDLKCCFCNFAAE